MWPYREYIRMTPVIFRFLVMVLLVVGSVGMVSVLF